MISRSTLSYLRSLSDKTTRHQEGVFFVEGRKCMTEFIASDFEIIEGFFTESFVGYLEQILTGWQKEISHQIITQTELDRISTLSTNRDGLLLIKMKPQIQRNIKKDELMLVLDRINDPGNLGTIIRTADWYGVSQIICSHDTVDCYNPKVLMATMGSFTRVSLLYTDLDVYLSNIASKIYWAYLDGESTHTKEFGQWGGYLVIGSEAHGISAHLEPYITDKITIPRFGLAESLNAWVAAAVILDRMRG